MAPILLPANQPPERFYLGGSRISAFRASSPSGPNEPEDWIASTTPCAGCASSKLGMTRLPDGRLLADAVSLDPEHWLGAAHVAAHGVDTKLLVKLLDAGQRLPVHAHPHREWAREHIGARHGKAEAWHLLAPGDVYLGLREDVARGDLLEMVRAQDVEGMLGRMHRLRVEAGQTVYVPPGVLHAIGDGVFLVEVQEPEDLSILCEWKGFGVDGARDGHLGVGFERALTAVETRGRRREEVEALVRAEGSIREGLPEVAGEYFDLERVVVRGVEVLRRGFAVGLVCEGTLEVWEDDAKVMDLARGSTVVLPFGDGDVEMRGEGEIVVVRPPSSSSS